MKNSRFFIKIALFGLVVGALPGCKWLSTCSKCSSCKEVVKHSEKLKEVSAEQLKEKMAATLGLLVINVLPQENYKKCHIKGSLNVPMDDLAKTSETWDKNQEIIVYCANAQCPASKDAQMLLQSKGFTNVAHYAGGTQEWCGKKDAANYPCGGECKPQ